MHLYTVNTTPTHEQLHFCDFFNIWYVCIVPTEYNRNATLAQWSCVPQQYLLPKVQIPAQVDEHDDGCVVTTS